MKMFSGVYNQSCLVKYDKHLYKIKLMYKDTNPLTNVEARIENSSEIEEVIRAILNLFLTDAQVPSKILTLNYLINISFKFWKITQMINFYSNGKKLKCKFYIKLSIYSNHSMDINYMTVNDISNCKMKQKFPLPPTCSPSSSNRYFCNKGPLADLRNTNLRKKIHLITSGIDAAFKEHFLSHSSYPGEHLAHLNFQNNSTALKMALFSGNGTENYNTLFLHSHNENNLKPALKLHSVAHFNSLSGSVFNNNQNYLLKIQLQQNAAKTKESNSLQYFTLLINRCKLSEEYSSQFCKYTEYNFSAFDRAQKIKSCLKIKTVVIKYLTCCSLKYRSRNQITGTYLWKNQSQYPAKQKQIWLKENLKEFPRETVKKTCYIRKISFKNRIRKWKLKKNDQKSLETEDPEKIKLENLMKLQKEVPEKLSTEDPERPRKEDLKFKECDKDNSSQSTATDVQNEIFFRPNDRYSVQIQELQEDLKLQHLANLTTELD